MSDILPVFENMEFYVFSFLQNVFCYQLTQDVLQYCQLTDGEVWCMLPKYYYYYYYTGKD